MAGNIAKIETKVSAAQHRKFKKLCKELGSTMSKEIAGFIARSTKGRK
jgi:hypothetical protein